jgi:hypothetical protein
MRYSLCTTRGHAFTRRPGAWAERGLRASSRRRLSAPSSSVVLPPATTPGPAPVPHCPDPSGDISVRAPGPWRAAVPALRGARVSPPLALWNPCSRILSRQVSRLWLRAPPGPVVIRSAVPQLLGTTHRRRSRSSGGSTSSPSSLSSARPVAAVQAPPPPRTRFRLPVITRPWVTGKRPMHRRGGILSARRPHRRTARSRGPRRALSLRLASAVLPAANIRAPERKGPIRAPQTLAHSHRSHRAHHGAPTVPQTPRGSPSGPVPKSDQVSRCVRKPIPISSPASFATTKGQSRQVSRR